MQKNGIKGRIMNKKYINVGQILTMCCVYKSFIEKPEFQLEHYEIGNLIHGKYVTFISNIYIVYKWKGSINKYLHVIYEEL